MLSTSSQISRQTAQLVLSDKVLPALQLSCGTRQDQTCYHFCDLILLWKFQHIIRVRGINKGKEGRMFIIIFKDNVDNYLGKDPRESITKQ